MLQLPAVAARVTFVVASDTTGAALDAASREEAAALAWQLLEGLPLRAVRKRTRRNHRVAPRNRKTANRLLFNDTVPPLLRRFASCIIRRTKRLFFRGMALVFPYAWSA